MRRTPPLIGQRFSRWVAIEDITIGGRHFCVCQCDCNTVRSVSASKLMLGRSKSCGCLHIDVARKQMTKHGLSEAPLYSTWKGMMDRCYNPENPAYKRYGGRGIKVAKRWKSISKFIEDMKDRDFPDATLERINNDGNYEPRNVRWATRKEQNRNKSSNRIVSFGGVRLPVSEWAERREMSRGILSWRLNAGWSIRRALKTPVKTHANL